jgi:hypothetical protein
LYGGDSRKLTVQVLGASGAIFYLNFMKKKNKSTSNVVKIAFSVFLLLGASKNRCFQPVTGAGGLSASD